jgi:hypothetical protein
MKTNLKLKTLFLENLRSSIWRNRHAGMALTACIKAHEWETGTSASFGLRREAQRLAAFGGNVSSQSGVAAPAQPLHSKSLSSVCTFLGLVFIRVYSWLNRSPIYD